MFGENPISLGERDLYRRKSTCGFMTDKTSRDNLFRECLGLRIAQNEICNPNFLQWLYCRDTRSKAYNVTTLNYNISK